MERDGTGRKGTGRHVEGQDTKEMTGRCEKGRNRIERDGTGQRDWSLDGVEKRWDGVERDRTA